MIEVHLNWIFPIKWESNQDIIVNVTNTTECWSYLIWFRFKPRVELRWNFISHIRLNLFVEIWVACHQISLWRNKEWLLIRSAKRRLLLCYHAVHWNREWFESIRWASRDATQWGAARTISTQWRRESSVPLPHTDPTERRNADQRNGRTHCLVNRSFFG